MNERSGHRCCKHLRTVFIDLIEKYTSTIVCDALSTHDSGARAGA
jgi:hypothetical protein